MFKVIIISILVVVTSAGVAVNYTEKWQKRQFALENKIRGQHPCGPPQYRTVYLDEIVGKEIWEKEYQYKMKNVFPFGVILRRCENSGCCKKYDERCKPVNEADVPLTFMVKMKNIKTGATYATYKTYVAKDHMSCACQPDQKK